MSKPYIAYGDVCIRENGNIIKFPTSDEAWEYYEEAKENTQESAKEED